MFYHLRCFYHQQPFCDRAQVLYNEAAERYQTSKLLSGSGRCYLGKLLKANGELLIRDFLDFIHKNMDLMNGFFANCPTYFSKFLDDDRISHLWGYLDYNTPERLNNWVIHF
jgi:hypothetical protein